MAEPKLKLELPCPRCGMLNGPAAVRCRQCAHELEPTAMPDWPQPAPFDLPGAHPACPACALPLPAGAEVCLHCGEGGASAVEEAVVKTARVRPRPRPRRKVVPLLTRAGWANLAWLVRLGAALFLIWSVVDGGLWLNGVTQPLAQDDPAAVRYTAHAIYELVRNCVLVGALWLLTMLRPAKDD